MAHKHNTIKYTYFSYTVAFSCLKLKRTARLMAAIQPIVKHRCCAPVRNCPGDLIQSNDLTYKVCTISMCIQFMMRMILPSNHSVAPAWYAAIYL